MQWVRFRNGNRPIAVGIVTRLQMGKVGDRGSIPGKAKGIPVLQTVQTGSGAQQNFNSVGTGVFSGDKLAWA
jgi:hypothetical protein